MVRHVHRHVHQNNVGSLQTNGGGNEAAARLPLLAQVGVLNRVQCSPHVLLIEGCVVNGDGPFASGIPGTQEVQMRSSIDGIPERKVIDKRASLDIDAPDRLPRATKPGDRRACSGHNPTRRSEGMQRSQPHTRRLFSAGNGGAQAHLLKYRSITKAPP